MTAPYEPFDSEERPLADLIAAVPLPASLAAGPSLRAPRRRGVALRPLALAMMVPVVVAAIAGGIGLHAHFAGAPLAPAGSPGTAPPPRSNTVMGWDAAHHDIVLFGGYGQNGALGDTWTWDGSGWTEMHPADAPSPTTGGAMAFDENRKELVLVVQDQRGGHGTWTTWTWDGTDWHRESNGDLAVDAAINVGLAFDPSRRQLVLAAQPVPNESRVNRHGMATTTLATYTWSGGHWGLREATGPPMLMGSFAMAWDSAAHRVTVVQAAPAPIGVCGTMPAPEGIPTAPPELVTCHGNRSTVRCSSFTCPPANQWAWDGSQWRPGPSDVPFFGQVYNGTLVTNPRRDGLAHTSGGTMWDWNGRAWASQSVDSGPPHGLIGATVAADPDRNELVIFGGRLYDGSVTPPKSQVGNETWTWNGSAWTQHGGAMYVLPPSPLRQPPPVPAHTPGCTVNSEHGPTVTAQQVRNGVLEVDLELGPELVSSSGDVVCMAGHSFEVEIDGADGRPLPVSDNPWVVKTATAVVRITWSNWCGGGQSATLKLSGVSTHYVETIPLQQLPACTSKAQPSTLTDEESARTP